MASIRLSQDCSNSYTLVPNLFINQYMPQANGEFVKVYLYLLKSMTSTSADFSISAIADTLNHTENDILRALSYWEREGLLQLTYDANNQLTGIEMKSLQPSNAVQAMDTQSGNRNTSVSAVPASPEAHTNINQTIDMFANANSDMDLSSSIQNVSDAIIGTDSLNSSQELYATKREFTLDEVKKFRQDPDVQELFFIVEAYLKHPLNNTDTNTVLYWYDSLGFSVDLIEYLVEYCITKGHSSTRYMDKVAIGWKKDNITTIEQAKEHLSMHNQVYYGVIKALGITGRNLVEGEQQYLQKWTKDYHFELDIIQEACARTISSIHQPSFEYTDSILSKWFQNNVHTIADIKALDAEFEKNRKTTSATNASQTNSFSSISGQTNKSTQKKNKFNNFNQREYDYDELESFLLNSSIE